MAIKTITKLGLHGQAFHDQGFKEVRNLPGHLKIFAMYGTPEEHDIAMTVIYSKNLLTEAGKEEIDENRKFLERNPLGEESGEIVREEKDKYREQFESLTSDERKEQDEQRELHNQPSPDTSGEKTTI